MKNATKKMLRRIVSAALAVTVAVSASVSGFAASDLIADETTAKSVEIAKKLNPRELFCSKTKMIFFL